MNVFIGKIPTWVILVVLMAFLISVTNSSDNSHLPLNKGLLSTTYTH